MARKEKMGRTAFQAVVLILIFCVAGCSTWEGHKTGKKTGTTAKTSRTSTKNQSAPVEKEVLRPEQKQYASVSNPARSASMQMVQKGKEFLAEQKYNNAAQSFREAVIIDSTNGVAYYYMAKTRFFLKQYEEALGILDKAEDLLSTSEQWTEAVAILRTEIERAAISQGQASRDELIPIINKRDDS